MKLVVFVPKYLHINNLLSIVAFSCPFSLQYFHVANSNRFTRNQQRILEQNNQREDTNVSE